MIYSGTYDLTDLDKTVEATYSELKPKRHRDRFDFIAAMGMSSVTVASPVALALGKQLVIVRKTSDTSHSGAQRIVGRNLKGRRYIFIDDFVSSGATFKQVRDELRRAGARCVGQFMYDAAAEPEWIDFAERDAERDAQRAEDRMAERLRNARAAWVDTFDTEPPADWAEYAARPVVPPFSLRAGESGLELVPDAS